MTRFFKNRKADSEKGPRAGEDTVAPTERAEPQDEAGPSASPGRSRSLARTVVSNALLVTAALLVALLLAEGMVRLIQPQQLILKRPDVWVAVDSLGWVHRENVSTTVNTGERSVLLFTDGSGYRVGREGRKEAETRILVLGDSFLEALQVDHEQSISGLLEEHLALALNRPVAVRNAAVGGWDPRQYYVQAGASLERERFDLVLVFLYLGNDVVPTRDYYRSPRVPAEVHPLRMPRSLSVNELVNAVLYPINDVLEVRSHLFILLKKSFDTVLMRFGLTAAYMPNTILRTHAEMPAWAVTAEICRDIRAIARQRGAQTLFVLLPARLQVDRELLSRYLSGFEVSPAALDLDQPTRVMSRLLRADGMAVIDVLPELRAAERSWKQLYGRVDRHFTPAGHAVVAERLIPAVVELLGQIDSASAEEGSAATDGAR